MSKRWYKMQIQCTRLCIFPIPNLIQSLFIIDLFFQRCPLLTTSIKLKALAVQSTVHEHPGSGFLWCHKQWAQGKPIVNMAPGVYRQRAPIGVAVDKSSTNLDLRPRWWPPHRTSQSPAPTIKYLLMCPSSVAPPIPSRPARHRRPPTPAFRRN